MRTSDERIAALHKRAGEIRKSERSRRIRILQIASTAACVFFVAALAVIMPNIKTKPIGGELSGLHGSIFANTPYLGYIIIGIVAFLLGTTLTMFLHRLKKWQDLRDREDEVI